MHRIKNSKPYWENELLCENFIASRPLFLFFPKWFQLDGTESEESFSDDLIEPSMSTFTLAFFLPLLETRPTGSWACGDTNLTLGLSSNPFGITLSDLWPSELPSSSLPRVGSPTQNVIMLPFPLTATLPRLRMGRSGACSFNSRADTSEQWTWPLTDKLSMRDAVFIVSPKSPYLGFNDPITLLTTEPEWKPTRMWTHPADGSSSSICTWEAATTASIANSAIRLT